MIIGFLALPPNEALPRLEEALSAEVEETPSRWYSDGFVRLETSRRALSLEIVARTVAGKPGTEIAIHSHRLAAGIAWAGFLASGLLALWSFWDGLVRVDPSEQWLLGWAVGHLLGYLPFVLGFALVARAILRSEQKTWNALRARLEPAQLWTLNGEAEARRPLIALATALLLGGFYLLQWILLTAGGFPIPLAALIIFVMAPGMIVRSQFLGPASEQMKRHFAGLLASWTASWLLLTVVSYGGLVMLWEGGHRVARLSLAVGSDALHRQLMRALNPYSWFPLADPRDYMPPDAVVATIKDGPIPPQPEFWSLAYLVLPIAVYALIEWNSSLLKEHRSVQQDYGVWERFTELDVLARSSRSFRLLLWLQASTLMIFTMAALVLTCSLISGTMGWGLAGALGQPAEELVRIATEALGPPPPGALAVLLSFPLLTLGLALSPSILGAIGSIFSDRLLTDAVSVVDPETTDWLSAQAQRYGLSRLRLKVQPADATRRLIEIRTHGLVRRRALLLVASQLLDSRIMPRKALYAALHHELAHARFDAGVLGLLRRISVLAGMPPTFLTLLIDHHRIEIRADQVALNYVPKEDLILAIQTLERLEAANRLLQSDQAPRTGTLRDLAAAYAFFFNTRLASAPYPLGSDRMRAIEESSTFEPPPRPATPFWSLPAIQWSVSLAFLFAPPALVLLYGVLQR